MLTYFQIIQRILNTKSIYYPITKITPAAASSTLYIVNNNYWHQIHQSEFSKTTTQNQTTIPIIIKHLYFQFIQTIAKNITTNNITTQPQIIIHAKYKALEDILTNPFLSQQIKQQIQTIFEQAQKHHRVLKKFLKKLIKYYRKQNHKITTDLNLNQLDPANIHTFIVYENTQTQPPITNSYLFSIQDLIKIIHTAITNTNNFFENPLQPKNPYTNIPLTNQTLHAFFYHLHQIRYAIPPLLTKYYQTQFNLKIFALQNQMEIRDIAIHSYIQNAPASTLREEIEDMIDDAFYDTTQDIYIQIDKEFPTPRLIQILRPYLLLYLMGEHHLYGSDKRTLCKKVFKQATKNFIHHNPKFGKRHHQPKLITKTIKNLPNPIQSSPPPPPKDLTTDSTESKPEESKYPNTFIFGSIENQKQTPQKIFNFQTPQTLQTITIEKRPSKNTPIFYDEHPKFSIKDIEMYLQDPSKLKQSSPPQPNSLISPPPQLRIQIPQHLHFDSESDQEEGEESESDQEEKEEEEEGEEESETESMS